MPKKPKKTKQRLPPAASGATPGDHTGQMLKVTRRASESIWVLQLHNGRQWEQLTQVTDKLIKQAVQASERGGDGFSAEDTGRGLINHRQELLLAKPPGQVTKEIAQTERDAPMQSWFAA